MRRVLHFVTSVLADLITLCEQRFVLDLDVNESALLVRAIDRFYRRLVVSHSTRLFMTICRQLRS